MGGKKLDGHRTNIIEIFNPNTGSVRNSEIQLPKARSGFASLQYGNNILIIGGNDGKVLRNVDMLDLDLKKWIKYPSLLIPRDELAVAMGPDGFIYTVGGYGGPDK